MNYPKSYKENLAFRAQILRKCTKDPVYREMVRELFFKDILFAFNVFFFTYDPRKRPRHQQPFCTYLYQDETILALVQKIINGEDIGIEKSRDMGATWMVLLTFLWFWLNPSGGADFLLGSRIEDYVDKRGDPRTHFEKVRYALYRLPGWLRPKGFRKNKHDNFLRLVNPETGSTMTGESNNPNFSTQGRYLAIFFDEFAKWENTDSSAWMAAGDATPCRIPVSTPFGAGGEYYKIVTDGKTKIMTLHWTLHPEKAFGLYCEFPPPNFNDKEALGEKYEPEVKLRSPWYDKECIRRKPTEIAQELDIDYLGAGRPVFEGRAAKSLAYYRKLRKEPIAYYWVDLANKKLVKSEKPKDTEGYVLVFEEPKEHGCYTITGDICEGLEHGDYMVAKAYSRDTKGVVATFFSQIDEINAAWILRLIHEKYYVGSRKEFTWITPETNSMGLATFDKLMEWEIPNLFMMPKYDTTKQTTTYRKGWKTGGADGSRNMLIAGVKEWLLDRVGFVDLRCVGELGTFVYNKNGKAEAKSGCNDDEVFAFGICIQIDQLTPYEPIKDPVKRLETIGLREEVFSWESLKTKEDDSHQRYCIDTIEKTKTLKEEEFNFYAEIGEYY